MTQTVTTTRTPYQGYNTNKGTLQNQRGAPQEQGYSPSSHAAIQHQEDIPQNNTTSQIQKPASLNNINPQLQGSAPRNSSSSQNREYAPRSNAGIRTVNEGDAPRVSMSQPYRSDLSSNPTSNPYQPLDLKDEDDTGLARQTSIPRKQIGTSAIPVHAAVQAPPYPRAQTGQSRQQSAPKPLPSIPGYTDHQKDAAPQPSSILNRSRPVPTSQTGWRDPQDIVDRAKTDTHDTHVVETVAPGQCHSQNCKSPRNNANLLLV